MTACLASGKVYVVFRYDDFAGDARFRKIDEIRENVWQAEKQVDALFAKYSLKYVIAVVPKYRLSNYTSFSDDSEKSSFIRQRVATGAIEVAQHGYTHVNHARPSAQRKGEFRNRDYEQQLRDIIMGKDILCSACGLDEINTFVPPFNGWDDNTAEALKQTGFTILSADRLYSCRSASKLALIPCTATLKELETIADSSIIHESHGIIVVLYHPTDITKKLGSSEYYGVDRFDKLLGKLSSVSNVEVVTFQDLTQMFDDFTEDRCRAAGTLLRQRYFWKRLVPSDLLPGQMRRVFYLSRDEYRNSLLLWRLAKAGFIAAFFIAGAITRYTLTSILPQKWWIRCDVIATVLFIMSAVKEIQIVVKGYPVTAISGIPALFTVSFVIALLSGIARRHCLHKESLEN